MSVGIHVIKEGYGTILGARVQIVVNSRRKFFSVPMAILSVEVGSWNISLPVLPLLIIIVLYGVVVYYCYFKNY
jgi:hypothetical protein